MKAESPQQMLQEQLIREAESRQNAARIEAFMHDTVKQCFAALFATLPYESRNDDKVIQRIAHESIHAAPILADAMGLIKIHRNGNHQQSPS